MICPFPYRSTLLLLDGLNALSQQDLRIKVGFCRLGLLVLFHCNLFDGVAQMLKLDQVALIILPSCLSY